MTEKRSHQGAVFSKDRSHRYLLWRTWNPQVKQRAVFIGLNPSAADETSNDPTLRRCVGFGQNWAKRWRCGGLSVVNLYGFCSPSPQELFRSLDTPEHKTRRANERWLRKTCLQPDSLLIGMWGNHGLRDGRAEKFLKWIQNNSLQLHCIERNKSGTPAHPLYLPAGKSPKRFTL